MINFDEIFGYKLHPRVQTKKTDKGLQVQIAVPGCTKENVKIKSHKKDNAIIVKARDAFYDNEWERKYLVNENYDVSKTKGEISDGVITLIIPLCEDCSAEDIPLS